MALELVYTSAERGLRAGTSGFCTVAMSRALQPGLVPRLEALGGYRPGPTGDGPVARSYWRIEMSGGVAHVLSIVGPAPPDHTQRTNKFATYLVLGQDELDDAGPAWMLAQPGAVRTSWSGAAAWIEQPARAPAGGPAGLRHAAAWEAACGDAGWAGVLASAFLRDQSKPAHVIVPAGVDPLPLVDDAMHLLPPWARWRATFTTYFLQPVAGVQCAWRFCVDGTPGAEQARQSKGLVIDLTHPIGQAPDSRFVRMARTGTDPEGDAEAARQRRERDARAAAERARASQIRVVADPRVAAGKTAPRAPVAPRGLPIELDEPVAPMTVGLPRGTKIALGVGGGVLLLAVVAMILITMSGGQKQGGAKGPPIVPPALPPAPPAPAGEPAGGPGSGEKPTPQEGAGSAPKGHLGTDHGIEPGDGAGVQSATDAAAVKSGAVPVPQPPPPAITSDPAPEPGFPASSAAYFGKCFDERTEWKVTWPDPAPRFESAKLVAPSFLQGAVVDPSSSSRSRTLVVDKGVPIQLMKATDRKSARLVGTLAGSPHDFPTGWLPPAVAGSLRPEEWMRLVVGRLLVDDEGVLFQPVPPASVVAGGEQVIRDVVDPGVWIDVPGELTKDGKQYRVRAIRASKVDSGRKVAVDLAVGHLEFELVPDQIEAVVRFTPPEFQGDTPAELQAQFDATQASLRELERDLSGLAEMIDWCKTGKNAAKKKEDDRVNELFKCVQLLKERELDMLVDSTGKSVGFDRKPTGPGGAPQIHMRVSLKSIRGWDAALESLRNRLSQDTATARDRLQGMRQARADVQDRLSAPIGKCTLIGDDGYVVARITLMPAQPSAKPKSGGAP